MANNNSSTGIERHRSWTKGGVLKIRKQKKSARNLFPSSNEWKTMLTAAFAMQFTTVQPCNKAHAHSRFTAFVIPFNVMLSLVSHLTFVRLLYAQICYGFVIMKMPGSLPCLVYFFYFYSYPCMLFCKFRILFMCVRRRLSAAYNSCLWHTYIHTIYVCLCMHKGIAVAEVVK